VFTGVSLFTAVVLCSTGIVQQYHSQLAAEASGITAANSLQLDQQLFSYPLIAFITIDSILLFCRDHVWQKYLVSVSKCIHLSNSDGGQLPHV